MSEQVMGELYAGRAEGEPLRTVYGTQARLIEKAATLAQELGQAVEVVLADGLTVYRVTARGEIRRMRG